MTTDLVTGAFSYSGRAIAERLLVAAEVAELLAVPESWVSEATREGRLPQIRLGRRYVRYESAAIEAWIREQSVPARGTK